MASPSQVIDLLSLAQPTLYKKILAVCEDFEKIEREKIERDTNSAIFQLSAGTE